MGFDQGMPYLQSKLQLNKEFPFKIFRYASHPLQQPMHMHEYLQLAYVLKGQCQHQVRGKSLVVGKGDVFLILPGMEHSLQSMADKEYEVVMIDFLPDLIAEPMKRYYQIRAPRFAVTAGEDWIASLPNAWLHIGKNKQILFEQLLQDMQDEYEIKELGYEYVIQLSLAKLLVTMDREFRKVKRKSTQQPALADQQPIDEVKRYINDNYSQDIPLEHGAYLAKMAPAYFSHVFKKETGQNFVDYVNEVRIEQAMILIRRNTHTITQIGFQVGYHHLSHFIRTFKKRVGITPTEYKKTFGNTP
ncbi:hypothetical protein A8709_15995 [Paenibacillus pectinilyticus]|uniref:HTH araC/xylS-type domain-containing protein n=1 Tax=Paenibacillus pectinilyticus TaxID=512399 RepID=A0A1C1A4U4_9BACL|nr:AraC family transcriptional regulator [Paenibacillus pectinilyticus]OCT15572.1 hypothetical protein A8709_15995 [Paenibacillus pectinilyticus]